MANEVRLIDANALPYENQVLFCDDEWCLKVSEKNAPAVDSESLRTKGRWTVIEGEDWNEDMIYQCSVCKEEFVTVDGTPAENRWNYCPNCGAKMEG